MVFNGECPPFNSIIAYYFCWFLLLRVLVVVQIEEEKNHDNLMHIRSRIGQMKFHLHIIVFLFQFWPLPLWSDRKASRITTHSAFRELHRNAYSMTLDSWY